MSSYRMLRDLGFFRKTAAKIDETNENFSENHLDSSSIQVVRDSCRPPLITIQEPQISGAESDHDGGKIKVDQTPSRNKRKCSDVPLPFRTPEKVGAGFTSSLNTKNRFGWAPKSEYGAVASVNEFRNEFKTEISHIANNSSLPSSRGVSSASGIQVNTTPRMVRGSGRTTSNHSESGSTQSTPTKSVTKPPLGSRTGQFPSMSRGLSFSSVPSLVVNAVEMPHFDLKEDPSFWTDHNVQVLIRVRPLNATERNSYGYNRCLKQDNAHTITWIGQPETRFAFDHVACETVNQEMLFKVAGIPMVENCLAGYNSCVFAYGQTGSGKTHTMLGEINELEFRPSPDRGIIPRIFEFLFERIKAEEETRLVEKLKYSCKCSFLEIYNEQITDLLDPSSTNLLIREDIRKGVYVENLTEFEVGNVNDILKILVQGAANRKVAATNMNRESSRSHSVFTCILEIQWEKDATTNLRFARLNLVDLAGSERQKMSGAEGERLKEAANINKSLSTLGHVIMVLVDIAHGKQRHVPYRDSRLTFLLQDSLGGNSKTMIIANVSPSICCAGETLSTLKFAQRAKLIQNNAVVNEDASEDVAALQDQIRLLKEELSSLKQQIASPSLSLCPKISENSNEKQSESAVTEQVSVCPSTGIIKLSSKQLKSLESTLAGALRREQMTDYTMKHLEAEKDQLNRLVYQREEDNRTLKMLLKFREEKIRRMEALIDGLMPIDTYLLDENNALTEEIQLFQTRGERNPEITRFALENIRLLEQIRRYQEFYEDGEREILLAEISGLRDQLLQFFESKVGRNGCPIIEPQGPSYVESSDNNTKNNSLFTELSDTQEQLENCRRDLNNYLDLNAKLTRDLDDLRLQLNTSCSSSLKDATTEHYEGLSSFSDLNLDKEFEMHLFEAVQKEKQKWEDEKVMIQDEELMNLHVELDILRIMLKEEKMIRVGSDERGIQLTKSLETKNDHYLEIRKQAWKDEKLQLLAEEWEKLGFELARILTDGHESLEDAFHEVEYISVVFPLREWISEQVGKIIQVFSEKEMVIEELQKYLEDAQKIRIDMEWKLRSLRGVALAMTQSQEQERGETDRKILVLSSELDEKTSIIAQLESRIKDVEEETRITNIDAENHIQDLKSQLEKSEESVSHLRCELDEAQYRIQTMESYIKKAENEVAEMKIAEATLKTKEKIEEFRMGVCEFNLYMNRCGDQDKHKGIQQSINQVCPSCQHYSQEHDKDGAILLLKGEIEFALDSLKEVQAQMRDLLEERDKMKKSEKENLENVESLKNQVFMLQENMSFMEECFEIKRLEIACKVTEVEEMSEESIAYWCLLKEILELELVHSKKLISQKTIESSYLLSQHEEVRETMKDADLTINALLKANEKNKLEIEEFRLKQNALINERDLLRNKLKSLKSSNDLQKQQFHLNLEEMTSYVLDLGDAFKELKSYFEGELDSLIHDLHCLRSHVLQSRKFSKTWLEDICSEVIQNDFAVSVLHLCHVGGLLESVNGLNAENNFYSCQLSEANSMFTALMGKLFVDIENSRVCVAKRENETNMLKDKINSLENKILDLQAQEESMLSWSNSMSLKKLEMDSKLAFITSSEQENLQKRMERLQFQLSEERTQNKIFISSIFNDFQMIYDTTPCLDTCLGNMKANRGKVHHEYEDLVTSHIEPVMVDVLSTNFELLLWLSETKEKTIGTTQMSIYVSVLERFLEDMTQEIILQQIDDEICQNILFEKEVENSLLKMELKVTQNLLNAANDVNQGLSLKLKQSTPKLDQINEERNFLNFRIQSQEEIPYNTDEKNFACQRQLLQDEVDLVKDVLWRNQNCLDTKNRELMEIKETYDGTLGSKEQEMNVLFEKTNKLTSQNSILSGDLYEIVEEWGALLTENSILRSEVVRLCEDLKGKENVLEARTNHMSFIDLQNQNLELNISELKLSLLNLQNELDAKNAEVNNMKHSNSLLSKNLELTIQKIVDLGTTIGIMEEEGFHLTQEVTNLKSENSILYNDIERTKYEYECSALGTRILEDENHKTKNHAQYLEALKNKVIELLSSCCNDSSNLIEVVNVMGERIFHLLDDEIPNILSTIEDKNIMSLRQYVEEIYDIFTEETTFLETVAKKLLSENLSLQDQLDRKEEILNGLLFDLRLLQESASQAKDKTGEYEEMMFKFESQGKEFKQISTQLNSTLAHCRLLEMQVKEKTDIISALELALTEDRECVRLTAEENRGLENCIDDLVKEKHSFMRKIAEKDKVIERLEEEILQLSNSLGEMDKFLEGVKSDLMKVTQERDFLSFSLQDLKDKLEMVQALAEENEAVANEARQIAEAKSTHAKEKDEEVKLLEISVEELECTVNVLESKMEIVKGEAERQRLLREELEMELQTVKHQMLAIQTDGNQLDYEMQDVPENEEIELPISLKKKFNALLVARKQICQLKKEIEEKDKEIDKCKVHINELNMHAEAQAREHQQKFKVLEMMAQHVKPEPQVISNKSEKNVTRAKGSGSPFKCIGLGLTQQINSEKDEELAAARLRIKELETLTASRQKEMFTLNTRLAAAESMTHDVIRDLLGVKLDMNNYASMLDKQLEQKLTEKGKLQCEESLEKMKGVIELRQKLNNLIEERQSWLDEINQKHAELVAAQRTNEKEHERNELLNLENGKLQLENKNYTKRIIELQNDVKKLSGQQNLQQRIHHHAKIKEENNLLKFQNEDLKAKMHRTEAILSRMKEELAIYRTSNGKGPLINLDEEQRLKNKVKEIEDERIDLAQKLLVLCTRVFKVAGITQPLSDINPSFAEAALNKLQHKLASLERELQDLKFKNKICSEKERLSLLRKQSSPLCSRTNENCPTQRMP